MSTRSNHDPDDLITHALMDLDAAPHELSPDQHRRADERLAHILAADAGPRAQSSAPPRRHRRRRTRGLLLVAAALVLAIGISLSGLFGTAGTAYATWTAAPTPQPPAEQERLAQQCRDQLSHGAPQDTNENGIPTAADLQASDLVVADSRGDWSYVLLSGGNGQEATCLVEEDDRRLFGIFPRSGSAVGSYGFMTDLPQPVPQQIIGTGLMSMAAAEGSYWSTEGHVGSDVVAVTVLTATGTRVEATVQGDRFAAWWPQREDIDAGGGLDSVTYIVTLADGTELPPADYGAIAPPGEE